MSIVCVLTPEIKPVKPGFLLAHKSGFTGLKTGGLPGFSGTRVAFPNARRSPTAKVTGVCSGWWKTTSMACTEMDRRHSDVMRSRRPKSNVDDRAWTETTGEDSWLAPPVLADHGSERGAGARFRTICPPVAKTACS